MEGGYTSTYEYIDRMIHSLYNSVYFCKWGGGDDTMSDIKIEHTENNAREISI